MFSRALLASAILWSLRAGAAQFYASPTGSASGDGSKGNPWDLQTALKQPPGVNPGDTIWLRGGVYRIANRPTKFVSALTGATNQPITVRQYAGERATVDGNILQTVGGWVNYWGFEILDSQQYGTGSAPNRVSPQSGPFPTTWYENYNGNTNDFCVSGFDMQAPNVNLINLVVHDSIGGGFGVNIPAGTTEIYGSLSYYNGWQGADRAHGHGIYGQNQAPNIKYVKDCIVFNNFALGMQATGTGPGAVADNFDLEDNVFFLNGALALAHQANLFIGPVQGLALNPIVLTNFIYDTMGTGSDFNLGNTIGAVVEGNYFQTSATFGYNPDIVLVGNTFLSGTMGLYQSAYPQNSYPTNTPTANLIIVRPNTYEAGRANIFVYNWQNLSSVAVDVSQILTTGAPFEVRNAQDFNGPPVLTGTYSGVPLNLPMTGLHVAQPVGTGPPPASGPAFNAFVLLPLAGSSMANAGLPGVVDGSAAWGDYDNDGNLDVVLTGIDANGNRLAQVWRNLGNGSFANINAGLPGVVLGSVAWGDYDNDGNLDLLLTGIDDNGNYLAQVWRNLGNGSFANINAGLPGMALGSVAWGDFDNDGRLDILLTGNNGTNGIAQIWRNLGDGVFTNINAGLTGVYHGSVALADYDGDGWLDILLTGQSSAGPISQIWRNLGNGTFTNINAGLPGILDGSAAWGDYDSDGKPDIVLAGLDAFGNSLCQVWHNLGNGVFTNINADLPGVSQGSAVWGDYDGDGQPDLLLAGVSADGVTPITQLWQNQGHGVFGNLSAPLPGVAKGLAAFGDYNNDGRLDALVVGGGSLAVLSQLWQNNATAQNTPPTAPTGLSASVTGTGVLLSWTAASDAQTPAAGLSYNVRAGTTPGGVDVVSPQADPVSGARRTPQPGNAQERLNFNLTNLTPGLTYYWSVQAIDNSFTGSSFAPDGTFFVTPPPLATTLPASGIDADSATLNGLVNPNGSLTSVFFLSGVDADYVQASAPSVLGSGTINQPATYGLADLLPGTTYHFRVVAFNSAGTNAGSDVTFTTPAIAPLAATQPAFGLTANSATLNAQVNPDGAPTQVYFQYGPDTNYGTFSATNSIAAGTAFIALNTAIAGLSPGTAWHFQVVAINNAGVSAGGDQSFITPAAAPLAVTQPATAISANAASLNAVINSEGASTLAYFQYGLDRGYGHFSTTNNLGGGTAGQALTYALGNLLPGTTYHFQVVAVNSAGATAGGDLAFTTPALAPTATTQPAALLTANTAMLNALVDPNGAPTQVYFQYGLDTNYGNTTAMTNIGSTPVVIPVSIGVNGLQPGKTYHYQAAAANSAGVAGGLDEAFLTLTPSLRASRVIRQADGQFAVQLDGSTALSYTLQTSIDLTQWISLTNLILGSNGEFQVTDSTGTNYPERFYRLGPLLQ